MKKSVLLLFAVGLLGLSACGKNEGKNMTLDKSGSSVLTPEFVKVNLEALNQNEEAYKIPHPQSFHQKTFGSGYSIVTKGNGLIVVRNSSGYYGYYSTFLGKYIIEPCLTSPGTMQNVDMIGSVVMAYNSSANEYIAFDAFGNFFNLTYTPQLQYINSITSKKVFDNEGKQHVVATINFMPGYGYEPMSYIYNDDGSRMAYSGDYDNNQDPNAGINVNKEPEQGDLYKRNWMPLDQYGLTGYSLVQAENGYCTVFEGNSAKSSFYLPNIANSLIGVFNKKILTQQAYEMPEDAESYSYSNNGVKYYLESNFIDIENGKKEKLNFNVVFQEAQPLLNTKKQVEFYEVTYREINDQKILGNQLTKIVDGSFVVRDDVSGASVFGYQKVTYEGYDYFFNNDNKVLYNRQLKPVTFLTGLSNVSLAKEMGVIVARSNSTGLYGVVAPDGTVLVPFEYDNIYANYAENGTMLLIKDGDGYRYKNGYITQVATNVTMVGPNLFKGNPNSGDNYEFFSTRESLLSLSSVYYNNITSSSFSGLLGKYSVTLISGYYTIDGSKAYINVFSSESMNLRSYNMSTLYQERTNNNQSSSSAGSSSATSVRLTENSQMVLYPNSDNRAYFYISCTSSGYYYIYSSHYIYINSSYSGYGASSMGSNSVSNGDYNYRYEYYLGSGNDYGFYIDIGSSNSIGYVLYQYA